MARIANLYKVLRLDEGIWADVPGGNDFRNLEDAKTEARHYHLKSKQRIRIEDETGHCHMDSKFESDEEMARLGSMGS